ncbi:MAG: SMP-30/gluconolactonase/LRE family protein [Polyangiaceae bacterium]
MTYSRRTSSLFTTSLLLAATLGLAACDGNETTGTGGTGGAGGAGGDTTTTSDGGGETGGDTTTTTDGGGGTGGIAKPEASVLVELDPAKFELPEGLAIDGNTAYVGYAFTGAVEKIDLTTGERSPFVQTPPPPPNTSFVTGIGLDANKQVHAAFVSFTADAQAGIYRAPAAGGEATLFASNPNMVFPNGLAWDDKGSLYVTGSAYGGVFKIAPDGTTTAWVKDDLLAGDPPACGQPADALSVGANGLVWTKDALFIASSDQGLVAKVPVLADGSAGAVEVLAGPDCDNLGGLDGITLDDDGSLVGAVNRSNKLVRIGKDGTVEVLFEGAPLDFPASLAFAGQGADRALYVTSFGLGEFLAGGNPKPAIVKVKLP